MSSFVLAHRWSWGHGTGLGRLGYAPCTPNMGLLGEENQPQFPMISRFRARRPAPFFGSAKLLRLVHRKGGLQAGFQWSDLGSAAGDRVSWEKGRRKIAVARCLLMFVDLLVGRKYGMFFSFNGLMAQKMDGLAWPALEWLDPISWFCWLFLKAAMHHSWGCTIGTTLLQLQFSRVWIML